MICLHQYEVWSGWSVPCSSDRKVIFHRSVFGGFYTAFSIWIKFVWSSSLTQLHPSGPKGRTNPCILLNHLTQVWWFTWDCTDWTVFHSALERPHWSVSSMTGGEWGAAQQSAPLLSCFTCWEETSAQTPRLDHTLKKGQKTAKRLTRLWDWSTVSETIF